MVWQVVIGVVAPVMSNATTQVPVPIGKVVAGVTVTVRLAEAGGSAGLLDVATQT